MTTPEVQTEIKTVRTGWMTVTGAALLALALGLILVLADLMLSLGAIGGVGTLIAYMSGIVTASGAAYGLARTQWSMTASVGVAIIGVGLVVMLAANFFGDLSTMFATQGVAIAIVVTGTTVAAIGAGLHLVRQR